LPLIPMQVPMPPEPDLVSTLLTTSGPLGFVIALVSLMVTVSNLRRLWRQEERLARAKVGVRFIGVINIPQESGPSLDIYQIRVAGADGLVVSGAGLSHQRRLIPGWRRVLQPGAGFVQTGDTEIKEWLPRVVSAGQQQIVGIPAENPSLLFWGRTRSDGNRVRCWVEIGNHWIVDTEPVVVEHLKKMYK